MQKISFLRGVKIVPPWWKIFTPRWNDFYPMMERIYVCCPVPKLFQREGLVAPAEQLAYSTGI